MFIFLCLLFVMLLDCELDLANLCSFTGLAVMGRLSRSRLHHPQYHFDDKSIDWDHVENEVNL